MNVTFDIPDEHIAAALRFGIETGIPYWCKRADSFAGATKYDPCTINPDMTKFYYPIYDGKWVLTDAVSGNRYALNQAALMQGLEAVFTSHHRTLAELIDCTVTARTGDILIQCSLFRRVLYTRTGTGKLLIICPHCRFAPCRCKAARDITKRDTMRP
jgi:hypothetical protein